MARKLAIAEQSVGGWKVHRLMFRAEGVVEASDILGAIFSNLKFVEPEVMFDELKGQGCVGRIDIHARFSHHATEGTIDIPMRVDDATAAVVIAALEQIDKIGPCSARIRYVPR